MERGRFFRGPPPDSLRSAKIEERFANATAQIGARQPVRRIVIDNERVRAVARDLHRRRLVARDGAIYPRDYRSALAEVSALAHFDLEVRLEDLERRPKSLWVTPTDTQGHRVRVISRDRLPIRVFSRFLDADTYLFVQTPERGEVELLGWMPLWRVEDAPVDFWVEEGVRTAYFHEVDRAAMSVLPDTFDFTEQCEHCDLHPPHRGEFGAVWNDTHGGWMCFGCEVVLYDTGQPERLADVDNWISDPFSAGETEHERQVFEHLGRAFSFVRSEAGERGDSTQPPGVREDLESPGDE